MRDADKPDSQVCGRDDGGDSLRRLFPAGSSRESLKRTAAHQTFPHRERY